MARGKKLDVEIAKNYYTAKQAQQKLGMDRDKFNYYVRKEIIHSTPFLGGYGYYKKSEIDALAEDIEEFLTAGTVKFIYRAAILEDLDAEIDLASLNFGRKRAEATRDLRTRFLKVNPQISHYLFRDNRMLASINLVPFAHDEILKFREGKRGWRLDTDKIEQFEPGQRLECIIIDMMTTTRVTQDQRRRYASHLLRNLGTVTLVEWAKQGIDIVTVDACAGTDEGERVLKQAGFEFLGTMGHDNNGKTEERDIFHLDVDKSSHPLIQSYKRTLDEWKQQNRC
jgi:hypothetical protein